MEKWNLEKTRVYNLIVLDKSGSMSIVRKEAINGCNETIGSIRAAQQKHKDTQEHFISLATFCECGIEMKYDKTPIKAAQMLEWDDYAPCCGTPLFDAIGKSVNRLKRYIKVISEVVDTAVLVTIITDGEENASREWTSPAIKKLIDECKEEGWMFSFIGAGEEVLSIATTISITNTVLWEQTSEGTKEIFDNENKARDRFYESMAMPCCCEADFSVRKEMRKRFAKEYYKKDKEQ